MIMLISAPLATANRAMPAKTRSGTAIGPSRTTSSSGLEDPARRSVGTTIDAVSVTSR